VCDVACVCVSLLVLRLPVSRSLSQAGSQRAGERLAAGNAVYFLVSYGALLAAEREWCTRRVAADGLGSGSAVPPFTLCPIMLAWC